MRKTPENQRFRGFFFPELIKETKPDAEADQMSDKMTKEQERAALAAAESGDVFAMWDLSDEYRLHRMLQKKKYAEKGRAWLLKSAEGGNLNAMRCFTSFYKDDPWNPVFVRALDLLFRKYKAIYCDADRKEEARTILACVLDLARTRSEIVINGNRVDLDRRYRDMLEGAPEYEDDYDVTDWHHKNRYGFNCHVDDVEKYLNRANIQKYALVRPDRLDALEREVEALESTLPERLRKRLEAERSPQQELIGFKTDFSDSLQNYDYYIPARYVVKVIEDFRILPHGAAFDDCPYIEGSIGYDYSGDHSIPKCVPMIDLGSYLEDEKWGENAHKELRPKYMILIEILDHDFYEAREWELFAIPAASVSGPVRFNEDEVSVVSEYGSEAATAIRASGRGAGVLVHPDVLIEKLDLKERIASGDKRALGADYYQRRGDALMQIAKTGYGSLDRGVMTVTETFYATNLNRVMICGRVVKGKIRVSDTVCYYDFVEKKSTRTFRIEKIRTGFGAVEEAEAGSPVSLITDIKAPEPTPWDWHVADNHQFLVKVK